MKTSGVLLRDAVLTEARPLEGTAEDHDGLLQQVGVHALSCWAKPATARMSSTGSGLASRND